MNNNWINDITQYIENHLTDAINYQHIAKKIGMNEFIMQRVFQVVTGISLSEYIRKRRLSRAYEDLMVTDDKVIDISLRYGYESHISFARAFKKEFSITPTECRKNKNHEFQQFSKLYIPQNIELPIIKYRIQKLDNIDIYGIEITANTKEDLHYKIRSLYQKIKKNGMYKHLNENGRYAISWKNSSYHYLVGSKQIDNSLSKYTILKGEYAIFKVDEMTQKEIVKLQQYINDCWSKSVSFEIESDFIEQYKDSSCYIYVQIKRNKIHI